MTNTAETFEQPAQPQKPVKTKKKAPDLGQPAQPQRAVATLPTALHGMPATQLAAGMLGLIERFAENPDIDVVKMKELLDMQERLWNRAAEIAFNRDFDLLSQVLPRVVKKSSVGYKEDKNDKNSATVEAFKFALFDDIDEVVRPLIHKFGFSISHTTRPREGGGIIMVSVLAHKEGHSRTCELPLALDASGGKNNLQAMGSSTSYGRRYGTIILLNIITVGEDNDGAGAEPEVIDNEKAAEIDTLLREKINKYDADGTKELKKRFLALMKTEDVQSIKAKDYKTALTALAAIGQKPQQKKA